MCGIAGALAPRADSMRTVQRMHEAMAHRGPDRAGIVQAGRALLAHRRLSIIDLSDAAAQPMWDAEGEICIAYNGEIYNYRALREECLRRGARFVSQSDTEVILQLYRLDGETAFARLNGMFAFALVDTRGDDAFLVRDVMGIKPLYWSPGELLFASELSAFRGEVDAAALQAYAQLDFVPSPLSMIRGVRKLPGGHLVHATRDGFRVRRYREEPAGPVSAGFDETIREVVARQLMADVPLGVFLSGGIDSSIVARVAADLAGRISTFSIAFDDPSFDESPYFETVAKAIGSDHHTERITERTMEELLPEVPRVVGEPLADSSIFPTYLLAKFARRHVKVALSGDGADELFGGYPTHRVIGLGRRLARVRAPLFALAQLLPVSHDNLSFGYRLKKLLEGAHPDPVVQNERWLGTFLEEELPSLLTSYDAGAQPQLLEALHEPARGAPNDLEAVLRTDRRFYLQDGVLVKVDRATMASALEVRVPMLDDAIVRFASALPAGEKHDKRILRRWARQHFPRSIWHRKKKGFGAPLARWFRGPLRAFVRDTLAPDALRRDGFYQPAAVARILDAHERGRSDERKRIFNLLMFTLWYRTFHE